MDEPDPPESCESLAERLAGLNEKRQQLICHPFFNRGRPGASWSACGPRQPRHRGPGLRSGFPFKLMFPLTPGRHTLAIRCLGNWSDEVEFYWESASVPG
jgi:hypothetical protein